MKVQTGYLYHIKDEFFDIINDNNIMSNHEKGRQRPTYFTIKDGDILWFIPLSSKVDKYRKIVNDKIKKYGFCNTIIIDKVLNGEAAILIQNAFPTLEKYIDHVHIANGAPARVPSKLQYRILNYFTTLQNMKSKGINLFFADVDKIKKQMLDELESVSV